MLKLIRRLCRRQQPQDEDFEHIHRDMADWVEADIGRRILASEQAMLDEHLAGTSGYRGLVVKVLDAPLDTAAARQLHKFCLAPFTAHDVAALSDVDALPLPSDTVDVALLHHVLDFSDFPHEALKECARVIQPSGQLVIVGFQPWSLFGLWRLLGRCFSAAPVWRCRCLSLARIRDWLTFVGLEPETVSYAAYYPPLRRPGVLRRVVGVDRYLRKWHLPLGGVYVVTARKIRVRPIRGKKQWLVSAMKPVKLASRTQAEKRDSAKP